MSTWPELEASVEGGKQRGMGEGERKLLSEKEDKLRPEQKAWGARPVEPGFPGTEIRDNDSLGAQPAERGPLWDPPCHRPWGPSP